MLTSSTLIKGIVKMHYPNEINLLKDRNKLLEEKKERGLYFYKLFSIKGL